ncbi:uncharacterized protein TRIADDRAFT_56552 [Trichoplax adhaerens]|uniref:F-box domain-containing protein n=1 Tax=Trichoplax adhaerens TaxID=10228 RepID=B3RYG7_TRIAD|nr:hypothetical protein TRIADDRAFT_56552 [Trichoplax adhaerens]EDV24595.1 hypothetical protein TRIADDRAFT_56552 [Trichoplax adhaerens]|eukprot:XP_002112485.1 hypothetical protein TRIADDRAFT_56552 [Trichoplax adhaerens]
MADELERFRKDWLHEIDQGVEKNSKNLKELGSTTSEVGSAKFSQSLQDIVGTVLPYRRYEQLIHQSSSSHQQDLSSKDQLGKRKGKTDEVIGRRKLPKHDFVSALIADLDEVYALPFFDLELPKELCYQIFIYLSYQDLCHCSQVSKSWRSLADDDALWHNLCIKFGFTDQDNTSESTEDPLEGQLLEIDYAKEYYFSTKTQETLEDGVNLQERICKVQEFENTLGGVLCSVALSDNHLLAGYGLGEVKLYNIHDAEFVRTFNPIHPTFDYDEDGIIDKRSPVNCAAISGNLIATGLRYGSVDIWHIDYGPTPIHHYKLEDSVSNIAIETERDLVVASSSNNSVRADISDMNGQWQLATSFDLSHNITNLKISGNKDGLPIVVASCKDAIVIHGFDSADSSITLEKLYGAKITSLDVADDFLACGISQLGFEIPSEAHKLKIFSLHTGKITSVLKGHFGDITCINVSEYKSNSIITGSSDCKVRIYDLRSEKPVNTFRGSRSKINTVQSDDVKAVSGCENGKVSVWDRRMSALLWETSFSFPIKYCHFNTSCLVFANIPEEECQAESPIDDIVWNRRNRGRLRLLDFSSDEYQPEEIGLPSICSSKYDEPIGYNYNIHLMTPYDQI